MTGAGGAAALPILFRDRRLAIVDKPAGMAVHAGRAEPDAVTVESLFDRLGPTRDGPWLAHRLDRDTSGCLAIALRKRALIEIQDAFAAGRVGKIYWAVVAGDPGPGGTVRNRLARVALPGGGWRIEATADGDRAETDWRRRGTGGGLTLLELAPRTGRTHQIRAHCAVLGTPILGDAHYGGPEGLGRTQLHARALTLPLDPSARAVAPIPASMAAILRAAGIDPDRDRDDPGFGLRTA